MSAPLTEFYAQHPSAGIAAAVPGLGAVAPLHILNQRQQFVGRGFAPGRVESGVAVRCGVFLEDDPPLEAVGLRALVVGKKLLPEPADLARAIPPVEDFDNRRMTVANFYGEAPTRSSHLA